MMKILITGARGQLGTDCMEVLGRRHEVVGLDLPELDIVSAKSVENAVRSHRPDVIVNCAAYTDVDGAETDRATTWAVNAEGPRRLAEASAAWGIRLVHVSTDYVFDGARPVPQAYTEADSPHPQTEYGRSKLAGEEAIRETADDYAILRTAWLYGAHGRNFLKTMLRLALDDPERTLRVVNDQWGCPTWAYRLAEQIGAVLETGRGIFHAVGEGACTWYDLAGCFLGAMGVPYRLEPCTTEAFPTPARRPANSALENRRLQAAGLCVMRSWRDDVRAFAGMFRASLIAEIRDRV